MTRAKGLINNLKNIFLYINKRSVKYLRDRSETFQRNINDIVGIHFHLNIV